MAYQVVFTSAALKTIRNISDRRIQGQIVRRAEQLAWEPEKQGNPLIADLTGYRSVRAVGQRYRIIYWIDQGQVRVVIIATGIRREGDRQDVYALARRLVRLGLVEFSE